MSANDKYDEIEELAESGPRESSCEDERRAIFDRVSVPKGEIAVVIGPVMRVIC